MPTKQRRGGFLGIRFRDESQGVRVDSFVPGSPASKIGLEPGDLVTGIEGVSGPFNGDVFLRQIFTSDQVELLVEKGGERRSFSTSVQDLDRILSKGDSAPDFELGRADGHGMVRLSGLWETKPVLLVFGSYT